MTKSSPALRDARRTVREMSGLDKQAPLCKLANEIADYIGSDVKIRELTAMMRGAPLEGSPTPDEQYELTFFRKHLTPKDIRECITLFAVGAQITASACGTDYSPQSFVIKDGIDFPAHALCYYRADSNLVGLSPGMIYRYLMTKYAALPDNANTVLRQKYCAVSEDSVSAQEMIEGGMEESYHGFQNKNPGKSGQLSAEIRNVYGSYEQYTGKAKEAYSSVDSNVRAAFYANDPHEKDAAAFLESQQSKIEPALAVFNTGLTR